MTAEVVRTDFSDETIWEAVQTAIDASLAEFGSDVHYVADAAWNHATPAQIAESPFGRQHAYVFVVDRMTVQDHEHPIAVVDLSDEPGRLFRATPMQVGIVESNLSIANMDFAEFAGLAEQQGGIFRGIE